MRLRSGRTKVERPKTDDDLVVERIKRQYLVKRTEVGKLRQLVTSTRWWVVFFFLGAAGCLIFKTFWCRRS